MKNYTYTLLFLLSATLSTTSCNEAPTCNIPEKVSYSTKISNLIEIHCFKCHAEDVYKEKASRVKIYTYETLKKMGESGQLVGSINHDPGFIAMPYRKNQKIDSCDIETIKKWVATGMEK